MKIYFCDICNQSIPLKDLDDGLAVAVKGKIVCASCGAATVQASKAPGSPAVVGRGASGGSLGLVFLLAVGASLGGGWLIYKDQAQHWTKKLDTASTEASAKLGEADARVADLTQELRAVRDSLDDVRRRQDDDAVEHAARRKHDTTDVEARIENLKKYMRESETLKERVQELEVRIAAGTESSGSVQRDLGNLKVSLAALDATVKQLAASGVSAAPVKPNEDSNPGSVNPEPGAANLPSLTQDLQKIAKKLKDPDPGTRWEGVDELGRSRDARVVPYLLPHLKDSDDLVRRQAAEVLGDLGSKLAISPLIDALMDDQLHVRDSVFAALRKVSGQNIKYEPTGKKDDRLKQQRLWRSWFDQNQDKLGLNG